MTGTTLAAAAELSTGETVTFWILGPVALAGAFGTVLGHRKTRAPTAAGQVENAMPWSQHTTLL